MPSASWTPGVAGVRVGEDERSGTVSCVVWVASDEDVVVCVLEFALFFFFFRPRLLFFALWGPGICEAERKCRLQVDGNRDTGVYPICGRVCSTTRLVTWHKSLRFALRVCQYYSTLYPWCLDAGYGRQSSHSELSSVQVLCTRTVARNGHICLLRVNMTRSRAEQQIHWERGLICICYPHQHHRHNTRTSASRVTLSELL